MTASRCAGQAWASCSVRTVTVDWILKLYLWTLIKSTTVFSTQFPSFIHQDLSSSYHKSTNNSTLHKTADVFPVTFSHPVFRHGATISSFFVTKRQLWVYSSSSFSSDDSRDNSDDVDNDEVHFYSAWFHWLECSERWGRLFFSKEKLVDRKTEKSLWKTWKVTVHSESADKVSQNTGEMGDVGGLSQRTLLPWLFVVRPSRALGQSCRKLWNPTVLGVFSSSTWNR